MSGKPLVQMIEKGGLARKLLALDLLQRNPQPTDEQIREQLEGNMCRCTGYHNIVKAVRQASQVMAQT